MIFEFSPFTQAHVAISLIGIVTGFVVAAGLVTGRRLPVLSAVFLASTTATSVTGFFFPIERFTPGLAVGVVSLVALALAFYSRYVSGTTGGWWRVYAGTALLAQYLNCFVLVAQLFQKVPALHEIPFVAVQGAVLLGFLTVAFVVFTRPPVTSGAHTEDPRKVPSTGTEYVTR